jgi:outer membrane protein TolC
MLAVAEAYFNVQQARGELAAAEDLAKRADELYRRIEALAVGLTPPLEAVRARAERARRRQAAASDRERWRVASAELARVLRLESGVLVEPCEPPALQVTLVHPAWSADELIPIALTNRPELGSRQALVQATLQRLRQEKLRPLIPSVLIRSASTSPTTSLGYGAFGGGPGSRVGDFGPRSDIDVQLLWEWQNLGFGNKARRDERRAEHQTAILELFRQQDRIAAEVTTAWSQVQSALARLPEADSELRDATDSSFAPRRRSRRCRRWGRPPSITTRRSETITGPNSACIGRSATRPGASSRRAYSQGRVNGRPATPTIRG